MKLQVDETLLNELADHYTTVYGYQPCISKVCAYFVFDQAQAGITFDDLLQYFEMSKSTISAALKFLEEKMHIKFIKKEDCRKRYFIIDEYFLVDRYKVILHNLLNERKLTIELKEHFLKHHSNNDIMLERYDTIVQVLDTNAASLQSAISNLTELYNKKPLHDEQIS